MDTAPPQPPRPKKPHAPKWRPEASPFYQSTPSPTGRTKERGWAKELCDGLRQLIVAEDQRDKNDKKRLRQGRLTETQLAKLRERRAALAIHVPA